MTSLLIVGYKAFELGITNEKDMRIQIIKEAVRRDLQRLREDYNFKIATIFLFEDQGKNWNEANQAKLADFKQVDFVKYAYPSYQNPSQFREYNQFLLQNTDGAYLFYDEENETNLKYLYREMKNQEQYFIKKLTFDDLNEVAEIFSEK